MARDEEAIRKFVENVARELAEWGFPRMPARVVMTMMAADEEALTAGDLAERLTVSPAAISGAVRYLMHIGMLVREPVPGSRRDRYRLPDHAWYTATLTKGGLFNNLVGMAGEGVEALGGDRTVSGERIAEMRDYFLFVQQEVGGLLARWQATREQRTPGQRPESAS